MGAASLPVPVQALPENTPFNEMFVLRDDAGQPVRNFPYQLVLGDGRVVRGVTDNQGRALRVGSGTAAAPKSMKHDKPL